MMMRIKLDPMHSIPADTGPVSVFSLHRGVAPLLVSLPHDGVRLPADIDQRLTEPARGVPDTDWHIARLYAFAQELGASVITPAYSRYVVDLNRSEDDVSLYPGQNTTGLCPLRRFSGDPIYLPGREPNPDEVRRRVEIYWRPYHAALADELRRIVDRHGRVTLWEGHSIKSRLPFLFEGRLPDLNLGTADGASCSPSLRRGLQAVLAAQSQYSWVVDGRFKGGYITRHYGRPRAGVDAVQLEIGQRIYMDEGTFAWDAAAAQTLQALLRQLLQTALDHAAGGR